MSPEPIRSIEEFLAHALAIESEAGARYREFEAHFADRGDDILAGLCNNLGHFEQQHHEELLGRAKGLTLPVIEAHAYRWLDGRAPETLPHQAVFQLATPRQLLEIALLAEHRARTFFEWVAQSSADPEVARMAAGMAREEDEHVGWVSRALEYLPSAEVDWGPILAKGVGPGLALGEERRWRRKAPSPKA
jgi:rubrerythrin